MGVWIGCNNVHVKAMWDHFGHPVGPPRCLSASLETFIQPVIFFFFFLNKSSVDLKTEKKKKITDKLSCHQHFIGICHPVSFSVLNVGAIKVGKEKNVSWVYCWLLLQRDTIISMIFIQLSKGCAAPRDPEICSGWLELCLASTERWLGTPLVAWLRYGKTCQNLLQSLFQVPLKKIHRVDTNDRAFSHS